MLVTAKSDQLNFTTFVKVWVPTIATVIGLIFASQTWFSSQFVSQTEADALSARVEATETALSNISAQNDVIIEKFGIITGKLSSTDR